MKWISTSTRSTPSSTVSWSVPFWKRKRALAVYPGICQRWFKSVKITVHTKWYSGQRSKDVRSLDSKRLWEEHGLRSKQHHWDLPPLPPWLWSCWLLVFKHLRSVQVHKNCFNKILNSSGGATLATWTWVLFVALTPPFLLWSCNWCSEATYRNKGISRPYVEGLKSPMRKEYPDDTMASNEILSTLAKVKISEEWIIAQSIISTSKPFSRIMNTTLTREMLLL